ncbi:adenylate kinase family enzyme [Rhodococcus sp. 27YEA15]|uniref:AAA family ATPase n=1 Tax=Rhodococcus sp. 27YEA15 TaxID=3156259 RepID=UPI003C7D2250
MSFTEPAMLPHRPRKVLIAGTSGSGKTTLAGRVGAVLGIEHIELDGLFHGPSWTPLENFEDEVRRFSSGSEWVTEWQYSAVRALLAERADLMVWLDLPKWKVMSQLIIRTVRRRARREVLFNGNIEPPLHTILHDPGHVVRWGWRTDSHNAERMATLAVDVPALPIVVLRTRGDIENFLGILLNMPSDRPA